MTTRQAKSTGQPERMGQLEPITRLCDAERWQSRAQSLHRAARASYVKTINASESITGNSLIASKGGGIHAPVDFDDIDKIIDKFNSLFDLNSTLGGCF